MSARDDAAYAVGELWSAVRLSADNGFLGTTGPDYKRVEAAVKAALTCALDNGLVTMTPTDEWPEWISIGGDDG